MNPDFQPLVYECACPTGRALPEVPVPTRREIPEEAKKAIRSLLRFGGYKPSGRGRPASESLVKALNDGRFPTIHPLVDFFNGLSVQSGLPISVLDADLVQGDWSFRVGDAGESYVFNPSGQELKVEGLLLLADRDGPIGSPVKDSQRTKVKVDTGRFLVVVWGAKGLPQELEFARCETQRWAQLSGVEARLLEA
jgi:DNA/RNA-binding domain of Phe-tRNA-synthetase-like protein